MKNYLQTKTINSEMYRTHNCGELRKKDIGEKVILSGWIQNIRNFGSLFFLDIRDYFGITQIVLSKNFLVPSLGKEFIIRIHGEVVERHSKNYNLDTGEIEIKVSKIVVSIFQDKTAKQSIQMMKDINKLFDERLDENLRESLESVKEISNYKKIEL